MAQADATDVLLQRASHISGQFLSVSSEIFTPNKPGSFCSFWVGGGTASINTEKFKAKQRFELGLGS